MKLTNAPLSSPIVLALALLMPAACDGSSSAVKEPLPDAGPFDSGQGQDASSLVDGGEGGLADCVLNPRTHVEIINACTNAVKITKDPTLPKLLPEGGLPPLN